MAEVKTDFIRPPGWRFAFKGTNVSSAPDALPPDKYAGVLNARTSSGSSLRARPGTGPALYSAGAAITDLAAFAALGTNDKPIIVARDVNNAISLNGGIVTRLYNYVPTDGVSLLSFRPNQSPQAWIYVAGGSDFQKIQAPNGPAQKVGLMEPQAPVDAAPNRLYYDNVTGTAISWTPDGTIASTVADGTRAPDVTILGLYPDPVNPARMSLQFTPSTTLFAIGETVSVAHTGEKAVIEDVLPAIAGGSVLGVQSAYYNPTAGNTEITPTQMPIGTAINEAELGQLRRGALVQMDGSHFLGAGLNDAAFAGNPNVNSGPFAINIIIDSSGTPDTFKWQLNNGPFTTGVAITGALQALANGISVIFANTTGHSVGDETIFGVVYERVLDSVTGPNGTICFKVAGNVPIQSNGRITGIPAIVVSTITQASAGWTMQQPCITGKLTFTATPTVTEAIGTFSVLGEGNPFAYPLPGTTSIPQADDYVHFSVLVSDPTQINEIKIIWNVDPIIDYAHNVFYYSVRPSDLASVATNQQTQLAAILDASTNALIENQVLPTGQALLQQALNTTVSDIASAPGQTSAGTGQWTEVTFPISALQFLGGNENTSLMNVNGVQLMFNTSGSVTVAWGSLWVGGGGQPDIGVTGEGAPYQYRVRARSTLTGNRGNPSPVMQHGVRPTRQNVYVQLPNTIEPAQDIWDVFRYGGSVLEYRRIGSGLPGTTFIDQYFDDAARAGELLEYDNFEPFPSIDVPFTHPGGTCYGTYIVLNAASFPATMPRWLPGTLVQLAGNQAYTLRKRPQFLSSTQVLLTFEEAIGYLPSTGTVFVYEPKVARQILNVGWGPNEYGDFFFVSDPLRPGVVYWPKTNDPDSAPDANNLEIVQPAEPLIGGVCMGGLSFVASPNNWWALYPSFNSTSRYSKRAAIVGRGLVSPWGICTDGRAIYFWAKDCIAVHAGGVYQSLTDDLYVLFPHEGVAAGQNIVRPGVTFYAPDYSRAGTFRLSWANQYLFADYQDVTGTQRTMVCDLRTGGWCADQYATPVTVHASLAQQPGSLAPTPALYVEQVLADNRGNIFQETDQTDDNGTPIPVVVDTFEWDGGDPRSQPLFGDSYLDCFPHGQVTVQPVSLGAPVGSPTLVPGSNTRTFAPISVDGGGELLKYLGLSITWLETYAGGFTVLHLWQASASPQPELTGDRASDWTDCGTEGNKFFQGFLLNADTMGSDKGLAIQDSETDTLHAIQPTMVNHNGQEIKAYSFVQPFYSHLVRDVPQGPAPWRKFQITYIFQPAPESAQTWWTQATAFGQTGYQHIGRLETAYATNTDITLTITAQDGTSPAVIDLPANGGVYGKLMVLPTFNKGQAFTFRAQSTGPFQLYLNDWVVWVGQWGRQAAYLPYRLLGGIYGDQANV